LKSNNTPITFRLEPEDNQRLVGLCGQYNTNLKQVENRLRVSVSHRGHLFYVDGDPENVSDAEKVLRALYEMLGFDRVGRLLERGVIELAPLAYMRGRTLNEAFVILDEAQNTTVDQMKMFLTRIGYGSKVVVTGDPSQADLPRGTRSGLSHAVRLLGGVDEIGVTRFQPGDVVRHPLVQRIVEAYDEESRGADEHS